GIRVVIAESFERIHRSNLAGMGIIPVQYQPGESAFSLGLAGSECFDILGLDEDLKPRQELTIRATTANKESKLFKVTLRLDTPVEINYYRNGGILQTVLNKLKSNANNS
ncbi:MAG: aconitate hydratase, partial [Candidatus Omnitrophica bacterium]|nr:aconitate hydratase [Candidatus Omnitrophota bacterium]